MSMAPSLASELVGLDGEEQFAPADEAAEAARLDAVDSYNHEKLGVLVPDSAFDRITSMVARAFHMHSSMIVIAHDIHLQTLSWTSLQAEFEQELVYTSTEIPRGVLVIEQALSMGREDVSCVLDVKTNVLYKKGWLPGEAGMRFFAAAPLIVEGGQRIGCLCVADPKARAQGLSDTEKALLVDFAALAVSELQLKREVKIQHLSYITATAHNLQTPMACFDLCLGVMEETVEAEGEDWALPDGTPIADVLDAAAFAADVMSWTMVKAIEESKAQTISTDDKAASQAQSTTSVHGAGRKIYRTDLRALVQRCLRLAEALPCKRVPTSVTVLKPGDPGTAEEGAVMLPGFVFTDHQVLWHALIDLITNSCQHTETGDVIIALSARVVDRATMIKLEVRDTGPGLDPTLIEAGLFEKPFITGRDDPEAYGLGLYTVASSIGAIGGTYGYGPNVHNKGQGLLVWVEFPDYGDEVNTEAALLKAPPEPAAGVLLDKPEPNGTAKAAASAAQAAAATAMSPRAVSPRVLSPRASPRASAVSPRSPRGGAQSGGGGAPRSPKQRTSINEETGETLDSCQDFTREAHAKNILSTQTSERLILEEGRRQSRTGPGVPGGTPASPVRSPSNRHTLQEDGGPLPSDEPPQGKPQTETAPPTEPHPPVEKRAVIVDDCALIRKMLRRLLEAQGYSVTVGADGKEGLLELMRTNPPLVFMDFLMPQMTGPECTGAYRRWEAKHRVNELRTQIVGLSANAGPEDVAEALALGMDLYLSKPITPKTLVETLRLCEQSYHLRVPTEQDQAANESQVDPSALVPNGAAPGTAVR